MVERVCALCAGGTRALRRVVSLAVCAAMVLVGLVKGAERIIKEMLGL